MVGGARISDCTPTGPVQQWLDWVQVLWMATSIRLGFKVSPTALHDIIYIFKIAKQHCHGYLKTTPNLVFSYHI